MKTSSPDTNHKRSSFESLSRFISIGMVLLGGLLAVLSLSRFVSSKPGDSTKDYSIHSGRSGWERNDILQLIPQQLEGGYWVFEGSKYTIGSMLLPLDQLELALANRIKKLQTNVPDENIDLPAKLVNPEIPGIIRHTTGTRTLCQVNLNKMSLVFAFELIGSHNYFCGGFMYIRQDHDAIICDLLQYVESVDQWSHDTALSELTVGSQLIARRFDVRKKENSILAITFQNWNEMATCWNKDGWTVENIQSNDHQYFVAIRKGNKCIYCWTVKISDGQRIVLLMHDSNLTN